MKVPLLDLKAQYKGIKEETLKAIEEVLESQRFIGGDNVSGLEEAVAAYSGTRSIIAPSRLSLWSSRSYPRSM